MPILSLEESLVICDEHSNLRLLPLVCTQRNNGIPLGIDVERVGNRTCYQVIAF